jgi:hypothetical protein
MEMGIGIGTTVLPAQQQARLKDQGSFMILLQEAHMMETQVIIMGITVLERD